MSTIKVIPLKEEETIICEVWLEPCPAQKDYDNFAAYYGAKERWLEKRNSIKTYPTLPSDSAWFEENIGKVVDVEVKDVIERNREVEGLGSGVILQSQQYAIPPKQDLWDEAMQLLHSHNPFTARKAKLIFEILQNNGYTLQKK